MKPLLHIDLSGAWTTLWCVRNPRKKISSCPIVPSPCASLSLTLRWRLVYLPASSLNQEGAVGRAQVLCKPLCPAQSTQCPEPSNADWMNEWHEAMLTLSHSKKTEGKRQPPCKALCDWRHIAKPSDQSLCSLAAASCLRSSNKIIALYLFHLSIYLKIYVIYKGRHSFKRNSPSFHGLSIWSYFGHTFLSLVLSYLVNQCISSPSLYFHSLHCGLLLSAHLVPGEPGYWSPDIGSPRPPSPVASGLFSYPGCLHMLSFSMSSQRQKMPGSNAHTKIWSPKATPDLLARSRGTFWNAPAHCPPQTGCDWCDDNSRSHLVSR